MKWAFNEEGLRVLAVRGVLATCPQCGEPVVSKCGDQVVHHWAHRADADCDTWGEGETDWHINWKNVFRSEFQEMVETHGTETHRADVKFPDGTVIEFQHSALEPEDIAKREAFWGDRLVWVWDAIEAHEEGRLSVRRNEGDCEICWSHHRKAIAFCERKIILDIGEEIVVVKRFLPEPYRAGSWRTARGAVGDEKTVVGWGNAVPKAWLPRVLGLTQYEPIKPVPGMLFGTEVIA